MISTRAYNLRGQVSALEVTSPLGDVLDQSFTYGYIGGAPGPVDGGPNLDQVVDNRDASQSRFYFYDDLDRLWKSTILSGTPLFTYSYDANGNRTQQVSPSGTTNYSYQASTDRIAQATGAAAKHYAHDAYGNRIWAGPAAYAGQPSHVYDQGNRLVEVRDPVTQAVLGQYTYDAAGRRVRKIAGGVTTLYFYDSAGHLVESQNLTASSKRAYVFVEDEPMGIVDQPPSGSPLFSWIHTDRLGTPLAVTSTPASGSAQAIWRATYEPFGLATPHEDPDGDMQSFTLDLRFPGQVFDAESGGHDNYHRGFDPVAGRYLSADPARPYWLMNGSTGGLTPDQVDGNPYRYASNNPLMYVDPDGRNAIAIGAGTGSLAGPAGAAIGAALGTAITVACIAGGCEAVLDFIEEMTSSDDLTDAERQRRNKMCVAIWESDTEWCDNNTCGVENVACHERANDNLRRCNKGESRLPRMP